MSKAVRVNQDPDEQRESRLAYLSTALWHAKDGATKRAMLEEFKKLHAERSPEKVKQMEQERGLC